MTKNNEKIFKIFGVNENEPFMVMTAKAIKAFENRGYFTSSLDKRMFINEFNNFIKTKENNNIKEEKENKNYEYE